MLIRAFSGANLSSAKRKEAVHFYRDLPEIPVLTKEYSELDGLEFEYR